MADVIRERHVEAPPDQVWPLVDDVTRMPEWFSFADGMEILEGRGLGRRQRLHGHWGKKQSEIDQQVVVYEPGRRLGWRHEAERLDGRPAPRFAAETVFTVQLDPEGSGTRVRLESHQVPASGVKGLVMRLFGEREVARNMEESLERLAAVVGGSASPDS